MTGTTARAGRTSTLLVVALLVALAPALAGQTPAGAATTAATTTVDDATASLQGMTLEQRVGQVFMVGTPATGVSPATASAVVDRHVGGVMLTGRSTAGTAATAAVPAALQRLTSPASTAGVPPLVATDQEGGRVQVLQGPGFSAIPTALAQGAWAPAALRSSAAGWGRELRAAGVDVDLAPVLDTVPSAAAAPGNPPIGFYEREYGYTPEAVAASGTAFAAGLADAGVAATAKHFPGLGRVTGNTDTTSGVTDTVTVRHDPYFLPFQTAVQQGVPLLMMSTAYYARIDPAHPAAFSPLVIGGLVRGDLGFSGVVVSDDLASARQVAPWTPGDRALQFLAAGGDLVLTVDPLQLPAMYDAVLGRARVDAGFRARVEEGALRVLRLKQARGVLPHGGLGLIGAAYQAIGGPASYLGDPVTPQYVTPGGVTQGFVGGIIAFSPATGAHAVHGEVLRAYLAYGGPGGALGYPTTDELGVRDGAGRYNDFTGLDGASVYWTYPTGPHVVHGAIRARWLALGGPTSRVGYPTTDELALADRGRSNDFTGIGGATLTWTPATGVHVVEGAIRGRWLALGGAAGPVGVPTTDEEAVGDGRGRTSEFDGSGGATVSWTPATDAHAVYGAIRATWVQLRRERGPLGYPLTDEADTPGLTGRYNDFVHGRAVWDRATRVVTVQLG